MSRSSALLDRMHRVLASSRPVTRLAIALRNQCRAIIKHRLMSAANIAASGEEWLATILAPRCRTFVDVGANVGQWSSMFLRHALPDVRGILYEPGWEAYRLLEQRFTASNTTLVTAALSDRHLDAVPFYEEHNAGSMSSLTRAAVPADPVERVVRVTTLDIEMERLCVGAVDFLKIDTEGHDLYVLRGASSLLSRRAIAVIQFEYSDAWARAGGTLGAALDLLSASGYTTLVLVRDSLYRFDYEMFGEFFTYANFVALTPEALAPLAAGVRDTL